ncbi:hypothetical protein Nepgr_031740 [Nepenthes gracilis]|uniref:Uncharacterized protein n=1 Tax=Nepenthes gracilis TaxID=150966 RepID=A0AAD3TJE0_NEPGR|nr:hypothetical protein Nepgr_031740 [Nepenthes gracilis]
MPTVAAESKEPCQTARSIFKFSAHQQKHLQLVHNHVEGIKYLQFLYSILLSSTVSAPTLWASATPPKEQTDFGLSINKLILLFTRTSKRMPQHHPAG